MAEQPWPTESFACLVPGGDTFREKRNLKLSPVCLLVFQSTRELMSHLLPVLKSFMYSNISGDSFCLEVDFSFWRSLLACVRCDDWAGKSLSVETHLCGNEGP